MGFLSRLASYMVTPQVPAYNETPALVYPPGLDVEEVTPKSLFARQSADIISYSGWTLYDVQRALDDSEYGYLLKIQQLLTAMMRDPVFYHGMMTRVQGWLGAPMRFKKPKDLPQAAYDALIQQWPNIFDVHTQATVMQERVGCGIEPVEVYWYVKGDYWFPKLVAKNPGNISYSEVDKAYVYQGQDEECVIRNEGEEWLLFKNIGSMQPHLYSAVRALAIVWFLKQEAIRLWQQYTRVHGSPIRQVNVPGTQRETEDLKRAVIRAQTLLGGQVFVAPQYENGLSYDLKLIEAQSNSYLTFVDLIAAYDRYITLVLLGAVDNTQSLPYGSRAKAQVAEKQTNKYLVSDCRIMSEPFVPLFAAWCKYNRIPVKDAPIGWYEPILPEDDAQRAEINKTKAVTVNQAALAVKALKESNVDFDPEHIFAQLGVELQKTAQIEDNL
jgi:hypothetical protein